MKHEEDNIQRAVIKYLRLQYPVVVYMAIPNGGFRSPKEAAIMSGLGVISGAPDIFIATQKIKESGIKRCEVIPGRTVPVFTNYGGLFLELKAPKGRLSENQKN